MDFSGQTTCDFSVGSNQQFFQRDKECWPKASKYNECSYLSSGGPTIGLPKSENAEWSFYKYPDRVVKDGEAHMLKALKKESQVDCWTDLTMKEGFQLMQIDEEFRYCASLAFCECNNHRF